MGQPRRPDQSYDPPVNAAPVSSQAGIFRGRLVIVTGPTGAVVGVFVYAAGTTPSLGNPPIASMTNSTTDPFGNAVQPIIAVYGSLGQDVVISDTGGISAITFPSGATSEISAASIAEKVFNPGSPTIEQIEIFYFGPKNTGDQVQIGLISSLSGTPGDSTGFLRYFDTTSVAHDLAFWGQHGFTGAICQVLVGAQPGTIDTTLAAETWHNLTPVAGFTTGTPVPRYRYEPIGTAGTVRLAGQVALTANQAANTTFFTLPAGYRPGVAQALMMGNNLSGATAGASDLTISTGGVMQIAQAGTNGNIMNLDGVTFPLD